MNIDRNVWLKKVDLDLKKEGAHKIFEQSSLEGIEFSSLDNEATPVFLNSFPEYKTQTIDLSSYYIFNFLTYKKLTSSEEKLLCIDLTGIHNSGGSVVQELSTLILSLVEISYVNEALLKNIVVKCSVSSLFFQEISKLRAMRHLLEKFFDTVGLDYSFKIYAENSLRELTLFDSATNILRCTSSVASAIMGGADFVSPFTEKYLLDKKHNSSVTSKIPLVLNEESRSSFVRDPGHGSFLIEKMTNEFILKSFELSKNLERMSDKSLTFLKEEVEKNYLRRIDHVHKRKNIITGINLYADTSEKISSVINEEEEGDFPLRRISKPIEELRLKFHTLNIENKFKLYVFGDEIKLKDRTQFVINYLEVVGIALTPIFNPKAETLPQRGSITFLVAQDSDYEGVLTSFKIDDPIFTAGKNDYNKARGKVFMGQDIYKFLTELYELLKA